MFKVIAAWLLLIFVNDIKAFTAAELPGRFDGAQLWRLSNINNLTLVNTLEDEYGGDIWTENMESMDVAIDSENLNATRQFLNTNDIQINVLHTNIQQLFDEEKQRNLLSSRSAFRSKWKSGINWKQYHDLKVIYKFLKDVNKKYPNITTLYTIGKTSEGRELKVLRISENPKKYKKIWVDGGIHAREWIAPAAVTYVLDQLITKWKSLPRRLKQRTWYFMPVVNPDGYVYSRTTDRKWRKNRAKTTSPECVGVDINRNFKTDWKMSASNPCSSSYRGPAAGSELETKAISKFLLKRKSKFVSHLSFHSYSQFILFPFASKKEKVKNHKELQGIGNKVVKLIKKKTGKSYRAGPSTSLIKYSGLGGTTLDWSYSELGAKYAFVIELRDQGKYRFLLPTKQIKPTGKEALIFVQTVAKSIKL